MDAGGEGRLDALVNNAGVGAGGPMEILSSDELRSQFEVNFFGPVALTRALLPALRRARGRLVFVSSIGGKVVMPYLAPYGASKHAIEAIADSLRVELASSHVQVALIEPGSVSTPIWDKGREEASRLQIPPELEPVYGDVVERMNRVLEETAKRGVSPGRRRRRHRARARLPPHEGPLPRRPRRAHDPHLPAAAPGPLVRPHDPPRHRPLGWAVSECSRQLGAR